MSDKETLLSVRDLNAWYDESHVLHGVNLNVRRGETVTILGRNGVGKTTTLRSIVGILRKRTGEIEFNGHDLMRLPAIGSSSSRTFGSSDRVVAISNTRLRP